DGSVTVDVAVLLYRLGRNTHRHGKHASEDNAERQRMARKCLIQAVTSKQEGRAPGPGREGLPYKRCAQTPARARLGTGSVVVEERYDVTVMQRALPISGPHLSGRYDA